MVAVGATIGLGQLSRIPYTADPADHAVIRLAWRARGYRVEECRRLTAEELADIPAHMRREEVCEGRILPYRLRVWLDGEPRVDALVRAAGARQDRPLYVYQELPASPGGHHLLVEFTREEGPDAVPREDERATPARLELEATVTLQSKEVALVTYDEERRGLELRDPTP